MSPVQVWPQEITQCPVEVTVGWRREGCEGAEWCVRVGGEVEYMQIQVRKRRFAGQEGGWKKGKNDNSRISQCGLATCSRVSVP